MLKSRCWAGGIRRPLDPSGRHGWGRELVEVVDAKATLDFGHVVDDRTESSSPELPDLEVGERRCEVVQLIHAHQVAVRRENDRVLSGFVRLVHAHESGHGACEYVPMTTQLLARARRGDGEAFRQLVEPHRRELQVHCYRVLGSLADAEDLLQETLLAAWQGLAG